MSDEEDEADRYIFSYHLHHQSYRGTYFTIIRLLVFDYPVSKKGGHILRTIDKKT
jgi:hypothetical protein